ncbi:MAG: patatin-like phospholipase family protein [Oscillospiraceae bacterium]|nr:patatin-like phospholipase family protein [Oscillospiraceae bacterium]
MAKLAVVLAGGGSRGAYQVGVWQALRELGVDYQIVTGTSVGALNGAMMAQGDYETARQLWENLVTTDVVKADLPTEPPDYDDPRWQTEVWSVFIKKAIQDGGLDFSPLEGLMARYTSEERIRASEVDFGVVTVEYPSLRPLELSRAQMPKGQLIDYVVASAACFPAFKAKEIDGGKYIDGGYQDNMPVNLALDMGAEEIVAVDLKSVGIRRRPKDSTVPMRLIRSRWDLGPFLLFEPTLSRRNIRLGYLDTMKAFGKLDGDWYAFNEGEWAGRIALLEEHMHALHSLLTQGSREPLARAGRQRLLRTLELGKASAGAPEAMVMPAAELAGRLLRLDNQTCWSCGEFDRRLLAAFEAAESSARETVARITTGEGVFARLGEILGRERQQVLLSIVYALLCRALEGSDPAGDFWRLSLAAPAELAASVYLWLLRSEAAGGGEP